MPELRKDSIVGRWVINATERARRPGNFLDQEENVFIDIEDCPFCNNQDPEIYSMKDENGSWKVRVVPSGTPVLNIETQYRRKGHGLYDMAHSYGAHEVVIETPEHIANMADLDIEQIKLVLQTYIARSNELQKDPKLKYFMPYKNYGYTAGSRRIGHSRSQIIATTVNPLRVKEKLAGAKRHFDYRERCVYCDIIQQELETGKRIIHETEKFLAIAPFASRFPFETLILPKEHNCDFAKGLVDDEDLAKMLKEVLLKFKLGLDDPAYNYIVHTAPFRKKKTNKWRTIEDDYHWHIELVPRLAREAGFERGSGFYICAIPPEDTAEFLREVEI